MRSQRVFTNLSCNQNCTYCNSRRATDDRAFIVGPAVQRRVDQAISAGADEVVLSGGEPAMRKDLVQLVAWARARGAKSVALETNATLLDGERARALAAAGLSLARVNLAGWGAALDAVTRDAGGFARTIEGVRALVEAKIPVEIEAAVVRSTLLLLPLLPARLVETFGAAIRAIVLRVPVDAPDPGELVSYEEAAAAIAETEEQARAFEVPLKLAPDSGPPPCVFPRPTKTAHLYAMTAGARRRDDHAHVEACAACQVRDRCAGLPKAYLARRPAPPMRPITEDRTRRRLSLISTVEEQIRREFVTVNRLRLEGFGDIEEHLIRVVFRCNQACRFCFVSTHLPDAGDDPVREAILDAGRRDVRITLTGGEPTLHPKIVEYARLARSVSRFPVLLQTNAIRLGDPALTGALVEAGVGEFFISLHGSTAEISDAVTEAPGTYDKTVLGIDEVHRTGLRLILNFVICERNLDDLVPYVRLVAARWPRALVNVSFVAPSSDVVPKERALVPRYSDVLPQLAEAVQEARRLGVQVTGFESMCGIPLCLVPASLERYFDLSDIPPGFDGGEFVKTRACEDCSLKAKCYGLRRGYLELHGEGELRPVRPARAPEPPQTIIDLPSVCERACVFCGISKNPIPLRRPRGDEDEVDRAIDAAPGPVLFTGDDALGSPRVVERVARAAAHGRMVKVIGPPRRGLTASLAPLLAAAGLRRWHTGIFGPDAAVHDRVVGLPGGFDALVEAAAAMRAAGVVVELLVPLITDVVPVLAGIAETAARLSTEPLTIMAYAPDTVVGRDFDPVVAPWSEVRAALASVEDARVQVDGVPLCVLPPAWLSRGAGRFERTDAGLSSVHPDETCSTCAARARCPGVAATSYRAVGSAGLVPLGALVEERATPAR